MSHSVAARATTSIRPARGGPTETAAVPAGPRPARPAAGRGVPRPPSPSRRRPALVHPGSGLTAGLAVVAAATGSVGLLDGPAGWWVVAAPATTTLVIVLAAWRAARWGPAGLAAGIGCALVGLVAVAVVVVVAAGGPVPTGSWYGDAWRDLLAGPVPAAASPATVLALALTSWVAAALAATGALVVRGSLLALLPATVLLVLTGLLGAPALWVAPLTVAAIGVHLRLRRRPADTATSSPRRGPGGALGTAVVLGCCVVVAAGTGLALPSAPARDQAAGRVERPSGASPLVWVAAWQNAPARPVFRTAEASGPLRWATLERYDGTTWGSAGTFRLTGPRTGLDEPTDATPVAAEISAVDLPGRWLPSPGLPKRVGGAAVLLDAGSGDLYSDPSGPPAAYRVEAVLADPGEEALRAVSQRPRGAAEVTGGDPASAVFADRARAVSAGAASDYDRLAALAHWCRTQVTYSRAAVPGQSLAVLEQIAAGTRPATADQVVGVYALMARGLGYPARVVVGFTPRTPTGQVLSTDVVAWPEVYLDGVGWHPFYPVALPGVDAEVEIVRNAVDSVPAVPDPTSSADDSAAAPVGEPPSVASSPAPVGSAAAALAAALGATGLVLALVRIRRQRGSTPGERLLDVWNRLQRTASRSIGPQVRTMTADQVADAVTARGGPEAGAAARAVGTAVTRVLYGGESVDVGEVAAAVRRSRIVRTALRRSPVRRGGGGR